MPIFEFRCNKCGHLEEVLQKYDDPAPNPCPECGAKKALEREVSLTSFQLKGGGWYKDLYGSVKPEAKGGDSKEPSKSETADSSSKPSEKKPKAKKKSKKKPSEKST